MNAIHPPLPAAGLGASTKDAHFFAAFDNKAVRRTWCEVSGHEPSGRWLALDIPLHDVLSIFVHSDNEELVLQRFEARPLQLDGVASLIRNQGGMVAS
jgi:hypothetical protein